MLHECNRLIEISYSGQKEMMQRISNKKAFLKVKEIENEDVNSKTLTFIERLRKYPNC